MEYLIVAIVIGCVASGCAVIVGDDNEYYERGFAINTDTEYRRADGSVLYHPEQEDDFDSYR